MTYIPYLGTFFFSRYPSVALARNIIKRGKTELPCLEGVMSPFSLCVLFGSVGKACVTYKVEVVSPFSLCVLFGSVGKSYVTYMWKS